MKTKGNKGDDGMRRHKKRRGIKKNFNIILECIKKKCEEIKRKKSQRTINKLNVLLIFGLNHAFRV